MDCTLSLSDSIELFAQISIEVVIVLTFLLIDCVDVISGCWSLSIRIISSSSSVLLSATWFVISPDATVVQLVITPDTGQTEPEQTRSLTHRQANDAYSRR